MVRSLEAALLLLLLCVMGQGKVTGGGSPPVTPVCDGTRSGHWRRLSSRYSCMWWDMVRSLEAALLLLLLCVMGHGQVTGGGSPPVTPVCDGTRSGHWRRLSSRYSCMWWDKVRSLEEALLPLLLYVMGHGKVTGGGSPLVTPVCDGTW